MRPKRQPKPNPLEGAPTTGLPPELRGPAPHEVGGRACTPAEAEASLRAHQRAAAACPSGPSALPAAHAHHKASVLARRRAAHREKRKLFTSGMGATPSLANPRPTEPIGAAMKKGGLCALCGGLSFALLNLCSFFKGVDDSVLPAVFFEVSQTLQIGTVELGVLTMVGSFTVGLASPVAGWLGTRYSRPHLIGYGCFIWSLGAAGMGMTSSYPALIVARAVNGVGLGMIGPLMYGMVVDCYPSSKRGQALGVLAITGSVGGLIGGWFATTVGSEVILGFAGWRFPLYSVALVGVAVGLLVFFLTVRSPQHPRPARLCHGCPAPCAGGALPTVADACCCCCCCCCCGCDSRTRTTSRPAMMIATGRRWSAAPRTGTSGRARRSSL
jgi:hypothetical protein